MFSGSDDLAPGVTFGGYVVHELVGRGGMASVYRAEHVLLEKPVALKVMDRSLLSSPVALSRFLREGRAAAAIKHPNVVDINDVGVHEGVPYLVMELLRGEDLDRHLRKNRQLDNAATVRLALPVISALHTAHSSGVVHRDIKPSNIFMSLGPDDQIVPKVLDFGISKMSFDRATLERAATPQNQIIGTPQYLPPEALHGVGEMGPLSDQYSLGVVLYQCITGRTPFTGDTLLALLEALSRGTFEPPSVHTPSVSPALERVILRALSASPGDRFPTIRDMGRALIELAAQRTQVVWGQAFATPPHGHAASTAAGVDLPSARRAPSGADLLLTPAAGRGSGRWRRAGLGLALVLGGALAATSWSMLVSEPAPSREAAAVLGLTPGPLGDTRPASSSPAPGVARQAAGASAEAPGAGTEPRQVGEQRASADAPPAHVDVERQDTEARRANDATPLSDDAPPPSLVEAVSRARAATRARSESAADPTSKAKKSRAAKAAKARRMAAKSAAKRRAPSPAAGAEPDARDAEAPVSTANASSRVDSAAGAAAAAASRGDHSGGNDSARNDSAGNDLAPGDSPDHSARGTAPKSDGVIRGANGAPLLD